MTGARAREPQSLPAWAAVADATAIGSGIELLDIGCGAGEFCALAAARGAFGPRARRHARGDRAREARGSRWRLPGRPDGGSAVAGRELRRRHGIQLLPVCARHRHRARRGSARLPPGRSTRNLQVGPARGQRVLCPSDRARRRPRATRCGRPIRSTRRCAGRGSPSADTGEVAVAMEMADAAALEDALVSAGALQGPCDERSDGDCWREQRGFASPMGAIASRAA